MLAAFSDHMARWMDPTTGTFLSVDPVVPAYDDPQSLNAYAYARNNPITLDDPTGMCPSECWYGYVPDGVPVPGHAQVVDPGYLAGYGVVSGQLAGSIGSDFSGGLGDFFATGAEGGAGPGGAPGGEVGFFEGIGQRFSNLATYGQFATDAQVSTYIEGAATAYLLGGEQGLAQFVRENGFATGTGALAKMIAGGIAAGLPGSAGSAATTSLVGQSFGKLGTAVANPGIKLTGVAPHFVNQAITRGVTPQVILGTLNNPSVVLQQAGGRFLFLSPGAAVVTSQSGIGITTYGAAQFKAPVIGVLRAAGAVP